jgi:large subunit ribosomal protein L28
MAAHCQVTGAEPGFGHSISHSHRRNKRRFDPNIQKKRYWVPSLRRNVTLQLSAKGIKTIDVRGIDVVVAAILARGVKLYWLRTRTYVRSSCSSRLRARVTPT